MLCTLCWRITPLCSEPVQQWGYVLMHVQSDAHIHAHTLCSSSLHCSDLAFYWVLITLHHLSCVVILRRQRLTAWLFSPLFSPNIFTFSYPTAFSMYRWRSNSEKSFRSCSHFCVCIRNSFFHFSRDHSNVMPFT